MAFSTLSCDYQLYSQSSPEAVRVAQCLLQKQSNVHAMLIVASLCSESHRVTDLEGAVQAPLLNSGLRFPWVSSRDP